MSAFDQLRARLAEPSARIKSTSIPEVPSTTSETSGIREAFHERKTNLGDYRSNAPKGKVRNSLTNKISLVRRRSSN